MGAAISTPPINDIESTISENKSLRDHLTEQLTVDILDARDRMVGNHLIELLGDGSVHHFKIYRILWVAL